MLDFFNSHKPSQWSTRELEILLDLWVCLRLPGLPCNSTIKAGLACGLFFLAILVAKENVQALGCSYLAELPPSKLARSQVYDLFHPLFFN